MDQLLEEEPSPLWKPIVLTVLGLTLLNLAVAYLLARRMGLRSIEMPAVVVLVVAVVGLGALLVAIVQWRAFLRRVAAQERKAVG